MCYTGDVADPSKTKYNIDYYLELAHQLEAMGVHSIAIKDMAGLLTPRAAKMLGEPHARTRFPAASFLS